MINLTVEVNTFKEYEVSIVYDDIADQTFDTLEEAQDACDSPTFFGLDCYISGRTAYGDRKYIEKRLATDNALFVTDKDGNLCVTER